MAVSLVGVISSAEADTNSDSATAIADGLRSFADRLDDSADALGEYQALAESLPLVDLAPGAQQALRLSTLLQEQLTDGSNALDATYTSLAELETDLEALDELQNGVQFNVGNVTIVGVPGGDIDVIVPITATRHVDQPLDFEAGIASIDGGALAIDFSLSTTLTFRLDSRGGAPFPVTAFSLVVPSGTPPTIDVCASVDAEIDAFTARLGFTDITLSTDNPTTPGDPEKAKLDACAKVTFSDPDSNGVLTKDEFTSHALTEIAQAALVDGDAGGNDLDATLYVDASLVPGNPDATIAFTDLNLAALPAPAVTPDFQNLVDFTSITPGDVANGLSQFIAAFGGSQIAGNGGIPFVKDGLSRAFEVVKPLRDYARRLTDAEVVCGTEPGTTTNLPTGSTANLKDDTFVYCRAKTAYTVSADLTTWTSPAAVAVAIEKTTGAAANPTIGAAPEQNAKFQMDGDGSFEVSVAFTADPDAGGPQGAQSFTAIPRPQTAQVLFDELAAAAGLDLSTSGLTYDPTTKSLAYRLKGSFDPAPVGPGVENPPTWDFGDQLRNVTHLAGLQASATATTTLDAGQVNWDATFGVILTASEADITPATSDPSLLDRFFVKVRTGADEHEISLDDLTVSGDVQLDGQVGFLGVHASGSGTDNTFASGTAFGVSKFDPLKPVVTVDINPGSGVVLDTDPSAGTSLQTISGAISVAELAFNLDDAHLDAVCNLKATAGLRVSADVAGGLQTLAEAGVAVNWPQVFKPGTCTSDPSGLQITPSASFNSDLFHFDPFPSVSGKATAVAANPNEGVVLIDGTKNPTAGDGNDPTEFPQLGNFTNLTLRNKTTGATCIILTIAAQELSCATSLSGGTRQGDLPNNNKWKVGDEYEVEGNALGMLSIILDNLDALVDQLEALGADVDATIPLINMSTKDLVAKIQSIKRTIDDLRGFPKAQIQCDLDNNFSTPEDVSVLNDGTTVYCRATTQNTPSAVRWKVETDAGGTASIVNNGESGLDPDTADVPGALTTVGPAPSTTVQFTVNDGDADPTNKTTLDEWQLSLEWADAGGANTAEFPPLSPPSTLQSLEELIEDKLGIADPNVFQLDLRDLPTPGVGPVKTGTAESPTAGSALHDADNFGGVITGHTAIRTTGPGKGDRCSITSVSGDDSVTCTIAGGWAVSDGYEIVGNGTKDLVIKLGAGFCGEAGGLTCDSTFRKTDPLSVPLNLEVGALGDLVSVDSASELALGYKARATLEIGIPLALALPAPTIVDTTGIELEGRAALDPINLSAGVGPIKVNIGAAIADKDPGTADNQPGVGKAKVGAKFTFGRGDDDGIPGNRTYDFGGGNSFFTGTGGLAATFEGVDQDCGGSTTGGTNDDACLVADLGISPTPAFLGDIVLSCDIQPLPAAPTCAAPSGSAIAALTAAINGDPLNFALLIQLLPQLLNDLEHSLSGAAQDVELPLVGEALDAGAGIVNTFNQGVVIPFAALTAEITAAGDTDGDTFVEPAEIAGKVQTAIFNLIGPTGSVQIGGSPANLILDLNGDGSVTVADVSVAALCGDPADRCPEGAAVTTIDDFRITVKLGQQIDKNVPFDLGLDGVPLSLQGGLHAGGGWSLLLDFGLSRDGPYLVKSGPQSVTGPLSGVTGSPGENEANRPADKDTSDPLDGTFEAWNDINFLQDDDATFTDNVEVGSWLKNVTQSTSCRITKVENTKLYCEDFVGFGGTMWTQTAATEGDVYEIVALHSPDKDQPGGAAELNLTAELGFGQAPAGTCATDPDALPGSPAGLVGLFSVDGTDPGQGKCLQAKVAFLTATVRDKISGDASCGGATQVNFATGEDPTTLCLTAFLDVTSSGSDPRITLANLGQADLTLGFSGDANVDIRFRTGVGTGPDFPSVVGKFHLYWGFSGSTEVAPDSTSLLITFDGLHLDAGAFIGRFLGPMVKGIQNVTKPLQPVIETLQAEVPIVSDLSKLAGEGPVTMLDLLEAVSGNDLSLVRSVLQLVRFINALPNDVSGLLIPLGNSPGSFTVSKARALGSQPTPDQAGQGIEGAVAATNLTDQLSTLGAGTPADECEGRGSTFGVCGMTFPFLADATQIFGVLMGQDVTLIRYDAGTLKAGAGFGYCFPPILIGPVPVEICIGGSFEVAGRFAMGYDTSGIRKLLEGGSGTALLDGIFIDDYNAAGEEVPEITFTGTVYAEGAVTVVIISVGIRGEIIFTTNLDLDDRPNPDGKLRIEEIINRLSNPICLFVVSGQIDAALSAFVEIDLFFFTKRFSIEIVRITLLKFEVKCEPEVPNLADVLPGNKLILNVGNTGSDPVTDRRDERNVQENVEDEKMTVRQMEDVTSGPNAGKTRFSIAGFGIKEDEYLNTAAVHAGTAVVEAHGHNGDDNFSFLAGGGNEGTKKDAAPVALKEFEPKVDADGDNGNDEITSGNGNDDITGGANNDKLITGKGADTIDGGTEDDNIDAGPGNDVNVLGGLGNDTMNGGPGGDTMDGQAGDDNISAGPDAPAATFTDTLIGSNGNDVLAGDGGVDNLFGDNNNSDCAEGAETANPIGDNMDALTGGTGNDNLYGGPERDQIEGQQGDDTICGNGGGDEILGGVGDDDVKGGTGADNIVGGTDPLSGTGADPVTEGDTLRGGSGRDYMLGDDGSLVRDGSNNVAVAIATTSDENDAMQGGSGDDFMWGQGGVDGMNGDDDDDEMRGGPGVDTMNGNANDDEMYGEDANDVMHGNTGNDYMRGGVGTDTMDGDEDTDEMYGDNDVDVMRGGAADDLMRGGGGDDKMEGNGNSSSALPLNDAANPLSSLNSDLDLNENSLTGAWTPAGGGDGDVIFGDADQDDLVGGSQVGSSPDDGDTILGNAAQDVIVGDNGIISRPVGGGSDPDGTTTRTVSLTDPNAGGADYIQGNDENDDIYAGGAGDLVHGDLGDDYIEGNGGADGEPSGDRLPVAAIGLYGDAGQDDVIGGTSQNDGGIGDGADDIWGGQGEDVIAGDNADITRTGGGTCDGYVCNTFRAGDVTDVVIRRVQIWDVDTTTSDPAADTSGGDTLGGQDAHDRLYGQGGDDYIEGGGNDDFVFGNAGADTIFGGAGQDDLVGGTGRTDSADQASATDGRLDAGDVIHGDADFDAIAGDNSRMVRQTQDGDSGADADSTGLWKENTFNFAVDRLIALMDVGVVGSPAGAGTSGNDQLLGGAADDVVYGQGGNDGISGGADQDLLEGNANGSGNAPDPAGTYGGAWPVFEGDVIHGDTGADDIAGGTGWIYRMVGGVETGDPIVSSVRVGADGRLDGGDTVFGDGGGDAMAGDNTVIERALTGAGAWVLDDLHTPDALGVVRRVMRQRDVATVADLAPLTNGTSGADTIYGNDGVDVAYGQAGDDAIQGNAGDDHLEGNAGDDAIQGNEGQDDVIGGTGRTFSNDETTAANNRIDEGDAADANDTLHGGNGAGGVASGDDDVVVGDNATVDRVRGALGSPGAELNRLPFNGTWGEATWDEPNILRVIRLLDVAVTGTTSPETNGTNGDDAINGEANEDVLFGQGGTDTITGDDADLNAASAADANPGDDYIEGDGGVDTIRGDLGQDDITGGGSATQDGTANSALDENRDGTLDPGRLGETLRDVGDLIAGDSGDGTVGSGDVIAGDNGRIQRPLAAGSGDWRTDANRAATLRDVQLFDLEKVGGAEGKSADPGESGVDSIFGNGGPDIAFGQGNGSAPVGFGTESGSGTCQSMGASGPGTGPAFSPVGDDDNDDLPDLSDPDCRAALVPGDKLEGQSGGDYLEGNQGSDYITGGDAEDDVIGGSSANDGHIAAIRAKDERGGFAAPPPSNLLDGHDQLQGNGDDDTVVGDNAFVDRYLSGASGTWITISGPGRPADPEADFKHPEEAAYGPYPGQVRRDATMQQTPEQDGAYGDDQILGGTENDDLYGERGNDWIEGNEGEDAIVGDLGKILDNLLGGPGVGDEIPDPPLDQFIRPNAPFLDDNINRTGVLKREATLYSFDISMPNPAVGHDTALGGAGNDWIHTGPGEDVANGNSGDDRIFLGDSNSGAIVQLDPNKIAHDKVDAGWGGQGHDHLWGGRGADFLDVRPRTTAAAPGIVPGADPATWFQVAGQVSANPGQTGDVFGDFSGIDFIYGGWDQDALQANRGGNGPVPGDRLLDWSGSYNIYYVCPASNGDFVNTRQIAPGMIAFLRSLSGGDGTLDPATAGTSGFRETAIVFSNEAKFNANPVHPDTPGHFNTACDP